MSFDYHGTNSKSKMQTSRQKSKPSQVLKGIFLAPLKYIKLFSEQSGIHGLVYVTKIGLTFIEKCFWLILVMTALYACIHLGMESLDRYYTKSTMVSLETNHYYWNTSIPSATICPMRRLSKVKFDKYCRDHKITEDLHDELFNFLESLANSTYLNFENIKVTERIEKIIIDPQDYMALIYNLTDDLTVSPDEGTRVKTVYSDILQIHTQQTLTEYGICYATNNFLSEKLSARYLITGELPVDNPYESEAGDLLYNVRFGNRFDGEIGYNFIGFTDPVTIFIHSPYETMRIDRNLGYVAHFSESEVRSMEIITSENFERDTTVSQRGCRFSSESNLTHFAIYTENICLQECRLQLAYKKCGCIPHFYPNRISKPKKVCSYKVLMNCFPKYKVIFLQIHRQAVKCNCLQNCQDSKVILGKTTKVGTTDLLDSLGVNIVVRKYPLIRFRRQIIFTFTDLLVSIGGTAGFFLGFSVLGAVEIIYFFTLRLFWYLKGYK